MTRTGDLSVGRQPGPKQSGVCVTKRAQGGRASSDLKRFLGNVGEGKTIAGYRKGDVVFAQGEPADAVFYIQNGRVKLSVVSEQGKEAAACNQAEPRCVLPVGQEGILLCQPRHVLAGLF